MQAEIRDTHRFKAGFTVIELLVIVALIGIIMSVAIPSYQNKMMRANRTDVLAPLQQILLAQERYYANNRVYTKDLSQLGYDASTLTTNEYVVSARECKDDSNQSLELYKCVEIIAEAQGNQVADGHLIMNTQGRSEREIVVNGRKVYEAI